MKRGCLVAIRFPEQECDPDVGLVVQGFEGLHKPLVQVDVRRHDEEFAFCFANDVLNGGIELVSGKKFHGSSGPLKVADLSIVNLIYFPGQSLI